MDGSFHFFDKLGAQLNADLLRPAMFASPEEASRVAETLTAEGWRVTDQAGATFKTNAPEATIRELVALPMTVLVAFIKAYALTNYEMGGWDVIVECYDDEAIIEVLGDARTKAEALAAFAGLIDVWSDRQADARNSQF